MFLVFPPPSVPTAPCRTGAILLLGWQVKRRSIFMYVRTFTIHLRIKGTMLQDGLGIHQVLVLKK